MRKAVTSALITIFAATAACSAPASGTLTPAAAPAAAPEAGEPTTTTTLSKDEAAQRYLAIVKPYNDALEALERAINAGNGVVALRPLAAATAGANAAHVAALRAAPWPPDVLPAITALTAESELAQPHWERAAAATSRDELIEAVLAAAGHDGSEAAATIRTLLMLDQYDEGDHGG